jgi:hypothetical protein
MPQNRGKMIWSFREKKIIDLGFVKKNAMNSLQEHYVDREIREREIRESEQHYEVTAKHSRIRAQLSYENPYDPPAEGEELRYVVTDEDQQHSQQQQHITPPQYPHSEG